MEKLVRVTEDHECDGRGSLEIKKVYGCGTLPEHLRGLKPYEAKGRELGLDMLTVDLQHFESGRTRPICEFLGEDDKCTRLTKATNNECDRVFSWSLGSLHSEKMSKQGTHCPLVVYPPSPAAGSTSAPEER